MTIGNSYLGLFNEVVFDFLNEGNPEITRLAPYQSINLPYGNAFRREQSPHGFPLNINIYPTC